MRGECIGQPEFGRHLRAIGRRPEDPERYVGARRRDSLHLLTGFDIAEIGLQLKHIVGEMIACLQRPAQRANGQSVGTGRAAEPEIDAAGDKAAPACRTARQ